MHPWHQVFNEVDVKDATEMEESLKKSLQVPPRGLESLLRRKELGRLGTLESFLGNPFPYLFDCKVKKTCRRIIAYI